MTRAILIIEDEEGGVSVELLYDCKLPANSAHQTPAERAALLARSYVKQNFAPGKPLPTAPNGLLTKAEQA